MSVLFHFFDHNGMRKFSRSDATEFTHQCDTLSFEGAFPAVGNLPSAGDLIAWQDDDDLWEMHEVTTCELDAFGDTVTITGSHIAIVSLGAMIIESLDISEKTPKEAIQTILGKQTQTMWSLGTMPAITESDSRLKVRYRTLKGVKMFAEASTKAKKIASYSRKKYLTLSEVPAATDTWWHMIGPDGRVGWIQNAATVLVEDGAAGDEYRLVTIEDQKLVTVWDMLSQWVEATGYIIVPRVIVSGSGNHQYYIDVRDTTPEYRGIRITCSTNIKEGGVKWDTSQLYTAMVGAGKDDRTFKSVVWTTAAGYPVNKPSGQIYVELPDALQAYGFNGVRRTGLVRFDTESNTSRLLKKTYDKLVELSVPKVTFEGTVADLYALGYGGQAMRLYDMVHVIVEPVGTRVEMRISQLTRDLVNPENTQPTIGSIDSDDIVSSLASSQSGSISGTVSGGGSISGGGSLTDGSVTTGKLADGSVTYSKLSSDLKTMLGI